MSYMRINKVKDKKTMMILYRSPENQAEKFCDEDKYQTGPKDYKNREISIFKEVQAFSLPRKILNNCLLQTCKPWGRHRTISGAS